MKLLKGLQARVQYTSEMMPVMPALVTYGKQPQ
jgi:hypothetical protein